MDRVWEGSRENRRRRQSGWIREAFVQAYAPCEPGLMAAIQRFLLIERRLPLGLVHRILDGFTAIQIATTVMTHGETMAYIQDLPDDFVIARGPCACRLTTAAALGPDGRELSKGRLEFSRPSPLDLDIQIARCGERYAQLDSYRPIRKSELLELERECHDLGLVPNLYVVLGGEASICHCSSRTCVPFLANQAIGHRSGVVRPGALFPETDPSRCQGSGLCTKVCHFQARVLGDGPGGRKATTTASQCYGCGLCAEVCPEEAIRMLPRSRSSVT